MKNAVVDAILTSLEQGRGAMEEARRLYAQFNGVKDALTSDDQAKIDAKLAEVQREYDLTHNSVQNKLRGK